jgi:DeoR/GlpR family transcriptional regulator of sugar metabolism
MDELDSKILDVLTERKRIHYLQLAVSVGTSSETARRRVIMLSEAYPKNIKYHKGTVELIKPLESEDLPDPERIKRLQKTLDTKEQLLKKKEEIEKKLKTNHLPHLEKAILESDLEKIKKEFARLKQLLGG